MSTVQDAQTTNGEVVDEQTEPAQLEIHRIDTETLIVPVQGTSPLLVHHFSEKAKRQMLANMQGDRAPKVAKDPEAEFRAATYFLEPDENGNDRYGFPVVGFKAATVGGARFYRGVTMTALRQSLYFQGELGADRQQMAVIYGTPEMREDVVRVGRGTDLRYRPLFWPWSTILVVTYVSSMLTKSSVLSLIDAGGMGVGVGEWRPQRGGDFGTFQIDQDRDVEILRDA